jgi:hypothetical protein
MVEGSGAVSYQKYDGASGSYQEIPNPNGGSSPPRSRMKWIVGAVLVAVVGVVYTAVSTRGPSSAMMDKAVKKSGLQVKADGKVKLFDEFSKLIKMEPTRSMYSTC